MIKLIRHIARLGGDVDGLTRKDRDEIRQRWKARASREDIDAALAVFKDLVVAPKEKRALRFLGSSLCGVAPHLPRCARREHEIKLVIGRYGRRVREQHMLALLKKAYAAKTPKEQIARLEALQRMKPKDAIGLMPLLGKWYGDPKTNPRVAFLARIIFRTINFNEETSLSYARKHPVRFIYDVPSNRRNKAAMLHCIKKKPGCLSYADPTLLVDQSFTNKALTKSNMGKGLRFLSKMPREDAVRLVESILKLQPGLFKHTVSFLKTIDPTRAYVAVAEFIEENPRTFFPGISDALQFLYAVDKEGALKWGLQFAKSYEETFRAMLPLIKKMPRRQSEQIALSLLQESPDALPLLRPFLVKASRKKVRTIIAKALNDNLYLLPYAKPFFSDSELVKMAFGVLKEVHSYKDVLDVDGVPWNAAAAVLAVLQKGRRSSNALIRKIASEAIRESFSAYPHKMLLMKNDRAIGYLVSKIAGFYKSRRYSFSGDPHSHDESLAFPKGLAGSIPKTFLSNPKVQRALLEASHNEIARLMQKHPEISIDRKVRAKYAALVTQARKLGITRLARIYTTSLLREIIKNRQNIDRVDARPMALVIFSRDHYKRDVFKFNEIEKYAKHYRLLYFEADTTKKWFAAFKRTTKTQKASLVYIAGHGRRTEFRLGKKEFFTLLHAKKLKAYSNRVARGGHIIVFSCKSGIGKGRGYDMATAFGDSFPHATVHAAVHDVSTDSQITTISKEGKILSIKSNVRRMTLHADSGMHRVHSGGRGPQLLYPKKGWGGVGRKMSSIEYLMHIRSMGYRQGLKLFPHKLKIAVNERLLLSRGLLK